MSASLSKARTGEGRRRDILTGEAGQKLSDKQALAIEALVKAVHEDEWIAELYRQGVLDKAATNKRARYTELRNGLKRRKAIGARDDLVWK